MEIYPNQSSPQHTHYSRREELSPSCLDSVISSFSRSLSSLEVKRGKDGASGHQGPMGVLLARGGGAGMQRLGSGLRHLILDCPAAVLLAASPYAP